MQKDSVDAERGVHADAEGKERDEETAMKKEEEEEAMHRKVEAAKKRKEEEEAMVVSFTRKATFDTPMQKKTEAEAAVAAAVENTEDKAAEKAAAENSAAEAKVGILANVRKRLYA